jgi:uncharacterized protein YbjT (DUF2867 family)
MRKTAIILGATGLTGRFLLDELIADDHYKTIKLFSRKSTEIQSEKIEEFLIDVLTLEKHQSDFTADEVYCCVGTTAAKTKERARYKAIDFGIPVMAAKLAKENGIDTFLVLSSMGANANSNLFYNRTKGEMEKEVLLQQIKHTFILRPSLLGGKRDESRFGEKIGKILMQIMEPLFVGSLKKYKIIHPSTIAKCMKILAMEKPNTSIFSSDEIEKIAYLNQ